MKRPVLTIQQLERINAISATNMQRVAHRVCDLAIIATDAHALKRREQRLCPACEYLRRHTIVGHAFTKWICRVCEIEQPAHHNTGVPALCVGCAEAYSLCQQCGGDIEMRNRGRLSGRKAKREKKGTT